MYAAHNKFLHVFAHNKSLQFVSPTDRHGRDALYFCNLWGCEQLVRWPTHIAGNRPDLMMTDVPDIVHVFVGTPLGTSITALSVVCFRLSKESHNERTRNTLKHSTCSCKWFETVKDSIFGVMPSIPVLRVPGGGLVVVPSE